jgi:hypothetical protein
MMKKPLKWVGIRIGSFFLFMLVLGLALPESNTDTAELSTRGKESISIRPNDVQVVDATWREIPAYHDYQFDVHHAPAPGMKFIWVKVKVRAGSKPIQRYNLKCYVEDQDGVRWNLANNLNAILAAYRHNLPTSNDNPDTIPASTTVVLYFEGQVDEDVIPEKIGVNVSRW